MRKIKISRSRAGSDWPPRMYPAKRDQFRASFGLFINTLKMLTTSPLILLRSPISRSSALKVEKSRNGILCFLEVTIAPPWVTRSALIHNRHLLQPRGSLTARRDARSPPPAAVLLPASLPKSDCLPTPCRNRVASTTPSARGENIYPPRRSARGFPPQARARSAWSRSNPAPRSSHRQPDPQLA